ncbi:MAG: RsmD family RNA methyltransferase [Candidatus Saccharimonadales bacterium]|jgi:16S rRNA (guanine966-N2)-methyltransferase
MRIIAGALKGRLFRDPPGHHSHPMSEKARGALFNVLGDISGLSVLDAFAGSGALAFEAISRGAKSALAIEQKRAPHQTISDSIKELGLSSQVKAINTDAASWSSHNQTEKFDIVFLDPPYQHLQLKLLAKFTEHAKKGGIVVVSWPGHELPPAFDSCQIITDKNYGDAQLVFYRKS